jgi:CRP/FNR family transcriptional regulator, nitrogen oxide reductase regulator
MHTKPARPPVDLVSLAQIGLFKGLPEPELGEILRAGQHREAVRGAFFFLQGDPANSLFVLLHGRVKLVQSSPDGQQVLMRAIGPYTLFGAVALAQGETYPVSAEVAEDSQALVWPKTSLMPLVTRFPQLALNAITMMASATQEFQERFRQLATERVERRLAHTLLRLASQSGKKIPTGVLIDLPLTRQDLAEMTGMTLFTVSRLLSHWESQGLIIADREHIVIRFPHGLVTIAEG